MELGLLEGFDFTTTTTSLVDFQVETCLCEPVCQQEDGDCVWIVDECRLGRRHVQATCRKPDREDAASCREHVASNA